MKAALNPPIVIFRSVWSKVVYQLSTGNGHILNLMFRAVESWLRAFDRSEGIQSIKLSVKFKILLGRSKVCRQLSTTQKDSLKINFENLKFIFRAVES